LVHSQTHVNIASAVIAHQNYEYEILFPRANSSSKAFYLS